MNSILWAQLVETNDRLRRRLASDTAPLREILVLTRDALYASQQRDVGVAGAPLEHVSDQLLGEHGLLRTDGLISAVPWRPTGIESGRFNVGQASAKRLPRQPVRSVNADLFYRRTMGREAYRTAGQRLAARSAVSAGPGDVLTCVLPTGSGKTDVFVLKSMLLRPRQSLVIVPTVSLALDLERRVREITSLMDPFAYHGGLSDGEKDEFRSRIAGGEQWLTITSPEAACTALSSSLKDSATAGRLGLLVIDEAHIVAEWGDDFRLEFQTLAALRRRLEQLAPPGRAPSTMLFTGTLDQHGYDTLRELFPGNSEVLVSDQSTRPEPEWWSSKCVDEEEKRLRLLEAVAHLPRPLLIYTSLHKSTRSTTVSDVRKWLIEAGYQHQLSVVGSSSGTQRAEAVAGLRLSSTDPSHDLDIVIATSAFGMGVDIDDVRTVIHACIPESIHRLYQEVGRAGRDGCASTSLMLWTDDDLAVAKGLAEAKQISGATAWIRWQRLRHGEVKSDRLTIDLATGHPEVVYPFSDANLFWNMQTLLGMQRAGMIRIEWPEPAEVRLDASDDELTDAFARQNNSIDVTVLQGDLTETIFVKRFNSKRHGLKMAGLATHQSVIEIVRREQQPEEPVCLNRHLADSYRIVDAELGVVPVGVNCGGCTACRSQVRANQAPPPAPYSSGRFVSPNLGLDDVFRSNSTICVTNDAGRDLADVFFRRISQFRTLRLVGPETDKTTVNAIDRTSTCWQESPNVFMKLVSDPTDVLTILLADSIDDQTLREILPRLEQLSHGIVYSASNRVDPNDHRLHLCERYPLMWSLESVLRKL